MEYIEVADAIGAGGMRLVLTAGVPGPWGEAAKGILHVKRIPYLAVRQAGGMANEDLLRWTGRANAPIAVYEDEPPRDGWEDILQLAERIAPEPRLIPEDPDDRILMFGLSREICGVNGFAWLRRLAMIDGMLAPDAGLPEAALAVPRTLARRYGHTREAAAAAGPRIAQILELLSGQLRRQRECGSRYFVGERLSALDVYWACFAALYDPLPEDVCPMPPVMRALYDLTDPDLRKAGDPLLLEHRDFVYRQHLVLPLDF